MEDLAGCVLSCGMACGSTSRLRIPLALRHGMQARAGGIAARQVRCAVMAGTTLVPQTMYSIEP